MSLLVDVMTRTVDPGYAEAARRRAERGDSSEPGARGRSVLAVVALVVVGAAARAPPGCRPAAPGRPV